MSIDLQEERKKLAMLFEPCDNTTGLFLYPLGARSIIVSMPRAASAKKKSFSAKEKPESVRVSLWQDKGRER
jgi:hypothetical protein